MTRKVVLCFFCLILLGTEFILNRHSARAQDGTEIIFPHQYVGNIDKSDLKDPSGICFHFGRGTLFAVSDKGYVVEMKTDGTVIQQKRVSKDDFEGVTFVPESGLLYAVIEGKDDIVEIDPGRLEITREFKIDRTFQGRTVLDSKRDGLEGIAFVADKHHPQGGTFFVTNQSFDLDSRTDISAVFEIDLPLKSSAGRKARILRYFSLGVVDLSGLWYDPKTEHLFVISDWTNTIFECNKSGQIVKAHAFPGENQEGIAADNAGFMYIAQDSGGIIKIKWER